MDKNILYRYLCGRASEREKERIADWLEADPANRQVVDLMSLQMETVALIGPDLDRYYDADRRHRVWRLVRRWGASAAAVVFLFMGSYYYHVAERYAARARETVALAAPAGQQVHFTLHDGTQVWLNSATRLEYPVLFDGKERRVKLAGEARFEVTHDARHPFIVETRTCDVEVLGTEFDVLSDEQTQRFSTALFRGRVEVTNRATGESVVLNPDEMVHLRGSFLCVTKIENADDYLWREGYINLSGHTFQEILAEYERLFDVTIHVENMTLPTEKFWWGKVRMQDGVDNAVKVLQVACPFRYTFDPERRTITIRSK